jgi:hypothetical protein
LGTGDGASKSRSLLLAVSKPFAIEYGLIFIKGGGWQQVEY